MNIELTFSYMGMQEKTSGPHTTFMRHEKHAGKPASMYATEKHKEKRRDRAECCMGSPYNRDHFPQQHAHLTRLKQKPKGQFSKM